MRLAKCQLSQESIKNGKMVKNQEEKEKMMDQEAEEMAAVGTIEIDVETIKMTKMMSNHLKDHNSVWMMTMMMMTSSKDNTQEMISQFHKG